MEKEIISYCNIASKRIAAAMGCVIKGMANEIIESFEKSTDWKIDSMERALAHAEKGGLAFACKKEKPHGHICCVYPAPMQFSGSLNKNVCLVANVGKTNGIMRVTQAFSIKDGLPYFWLWKSEEI